MAIKEHDLINSDFILDEIESIEFIGSKDTVDIEVDDTHMFYANDVYSHNSGESSEFITGENVSEDYSKIMTGDFVFSISRKMNDAVNKTAKIYIIKNRFGPDKMLLPAKFDLDTGELQIYEANSVNGIAINNNSKSDDDYIKQRISQKYFSNKN